MSFGRFLAGVNYHGNFGRRNLVFRDGFEVRQDTHGRCCSSSSSDYNWMSLDPSNPASYLSGSGEEGRNGNVGHEEGGNRNVRGKEQQLLLDGRRMLFFVLGATVVWFELLDLRRLSLGTIIVVVAETLLNEVVGERDIVLPATDCKTATS